MKRTIKVGIIQQTCTNDIRHNLSKLHHNIEQVAAAGAQLVVLQELHNTPYFCQTEDTDMFDLAEPVPGPSTGFYSELFRVGCCQRYCAGHFSVRETRSRIVS